VTAARRGRGAGRSRRAPARRGGARGGGKRPRGRTATADGQALRRRAALVLRRLRAEYPDARCALDHQNAYQLLVATILSAQCTDARVNQVTPAFFARYPDPFALAAARPAEVEELIRSTGFYRNKTRSLIGMAQALVAEHGGEVPRTMAALEGLPGVGRKTANVVLGNAFGINEGIVVDTHVTRLARRLGLTKHTDAAKIERDLMPLFPQDEWALVAHLLIFHGRRVCLARRPRCEACVLNDICPSSLV